MDKIYSTIPEQVKALEDLKKLIGVKTFRLKTIILLISFFLFLTITSLIKFTGDKNWIISKSSIK